VIYIISYVDDFKIKKMIDKIKADKDTVFIIGSGTSLNKVDISKLKDCNTISMNRQYIAYPEWGFTPTYYVIIDSKLIRTIHKDVEKLIKEEDIKKFFIMKHPDNSMTGWVDKMRLEESDRIVPVFASRRQEILSKSIRSLANKPINFCGNAGACSVEIARHLGYKKVILLGIDAKYADRNDSIKAEKDLSHFHPNYFDVNTFKEGLNQGIHGENAGVRYWKKFSEQQVSIPDFEVISSSPDSPINEFLKYVEFEDLFVS
jgi:hypothetical protein|tara:strand:+ start:30265 stop:31044 length:780 start_codon:yes stop_codon:yes gene_type:complete